MTFGDQHQSMVKIADAILAAVQSGGERLRRLPALRLQLAREVNDHVREETALIRQRRDDRSVGDAVEKALISRYHDELLDWRRQLGSCNVDWPPSRVAANPIGFRIAFQPLRDALWRRVRWEEDVFYPRVLARADLLGKAV